MTTSCEPTVSRVPGGYVPGGCVLGIVLQEDATKVLCKNGSVRSPVVANDGQWEGRDFGFFC